MEVRSDLAGDLVGEPRYFVQFAQAREPTPFLAASDDFEAVTGKTGNPIELVYGGSVEINRHHLLAGRRAWFQGETLSMAPAIEPHRS